MKVLKGNHFDVNCKISEQFKYKIEGLTFKKLEKQKVEKILNALQNYPSIVRELEGRAKGLNISLEEFLYFISYELEEADLEKCSDLYVGLNENKYIIHNEDGSEELEFFICDYEDERVFDLACCGALHGTTFSATKYIMFSVNYIYNNNYNLNNDLPTWIFARILLLCKNIKEVKDVLQKFSIWGSVSINLLDIKANKLYSIEKCGSEHGIEEIKGIYFHTNTIIHPNMLQFSKLPEFVNTTQARYNKIKQLLSEGELSFEEIMLYSNGNDYDSVRMIGKNGKKSKTQKTIRFSSTKIEILGEENDACFLVEELFNN